MSKRLVAIAALALSLTSCGWIVRQLTIGYISVDSSLVPKHVSIELDRRFIERYKNRVTVHTAFKVDKAMAGPLPPPLDGDFHIVGRARQVELPIVAEIANAGEEKTAVDLVHRVEARHGSLSLSGIWRIWPEHAGRAREEQGESLRAFHTDNPDHVFEIHPVTRIERLSLRDSVHPVKGFEPGDAARTFGIFQKATCTLEVKPKTVTIVAETGLYNDVEFVMKLASQPPLVVRDGRFVIASAMDKNGALLVERLRMVFAKGTPPEEAVKRLKGGDQLHVFGVPRIDFAEIARRAKSERPGVKTRPQPLPYEIVIIGVYPK